MRDGPRVPGSGLLPEALERCLYDEAPLGLCTVSVGDRIVNANLTLAKMSGLPLAKLLGSRFHLLVAPADRASLATLCARAASTEGPAVARLHLVGPVPAPLGVDLIVVSGGGAEPVLHITLCPRRGVAAGSSPELTHTREALRAQEDTYRRIVETAEEGIWTIDAESRTDFVNPKMAEMLGYSVEEMLGQPLAAFMTATAREISDTNVKRRQAGIAEQHDFEFLRRDGSTLWATLSTNPITDAEGAYLGALAMVTDNSARRKVEEELRRSNRGLRATLNALPDVLFELDERGRMIGFHAPRQSDLFAPPEEFLGRTVGEVLPPVAAQVVEAALAEARVHGVHRGAIYALPLPDGLRWFELTVVKKDSGDGELGEFVALARDVTALRHAEAERLEHERKLLHTQKLESLGVLAGGIAHDFNNLLAGILGNAELAQLHLPPASASAPYLQRAVTGVLRAADLATQMLAYSGQGRFVVEPLHLSALVGELNSLLHAAISKKCVITYELTGGLPTVAADSSQLRQVAMNLIINASEAIGNSGGTITVRTGVMTCDHDYLAGAVHPQDLPEGAYVYLEVRDDGPGMDEATSTRLFDPFFTTKFTGRGLGLSAVLGIVRGHRGAIRVQSAPGAGACFRVLLPVSAGGERPTEPEGSAEERLWEGLALVVDDEEVVLESARGMLEAMGFTVLGAQGGRDAIEQLRRAPTVKVVLLDLTMPDLDGIETLGLMRAIRGALPVILSSGYDVGASAEGAGRSGPTTFLKKPYRYGDLARALGTVLGGP